MRRNHQHPAGCGFGGNDRAQKPLDHQKQYWKWMKISDLPIKISIESIQGFCQRYGVRRLSLFGSVLRPDFTPDSDVDVLVEFKPGQVRWFFWFGKNGARVNRAVATASRFASRSRS